MLGDVKAALLRPVNSNLNKCCIMVLMIVESQISTFGHTSEILSFF